MSLEYCKAWLASGETESQKRTQRVDFLQEVSTKDLVAEIEKRVGVKSIRVEPHRVYAFGTNNLYEESTGPVVVLIVSD